MKKNNFLDWFPEKKWKPFVTTFIFSTLVAVALFLPSYFNDRKNIELTKEALRPRLAVEAIKVEPYDSYILSEVVSGGVRLTMRLRVTNNGASTAEDVKMSDIYFNSSETFVESNTTIGRSNLKADIVPSGFIPLTPTEYKEFEITIVLPVISGTTPTRLVEEIREGKKTFMFPVEITYRGRDGVLDSGKVGFLMGYSSKKIDIKYGVNP